MKDHEITKEIEKLGYEILSIGTSWIYYTDGVNIAYVQIDRLVGYSFSTVNKPNKNNGSGYGIVDPRGYIIPFAEAAHLALVTTKPSWDRYSNHTVVKYTIEEFKKLNKIA